MGAQVEEQARTRRSRQEVGEQEDEEQAEAIREEIYQKGKGQDEEDEESSQEDGKEGRERREKGCQQGKACSKEQGHCSQTESQSCSKGLGCSQDESCAFIKDA